MKKKIMQTPTLRSRGITLKKKRDNPGQGHKKPDGDVFADGSAWDRQRIRTLWGSAPARWTLAH